MNASTFTTGEVRLSYCHLFKPDTPPGSSEPCFSVQALIPKADMATLTAYNAAYEDAKNYGIQNKWNGVLPPNLLGGLKDGDGVKNDGAPYGPECKGCYLLTCKTGVDYPPQIVDRNVQDIIDTRKVYSGCYGRVNVSLVPYNNNSKGITTLLNCVQITRDGEPLGGSAVTAAEAFGTAVPAGMPSAPAYQIPGGYAAPAYAAPPSAPAYPGYPGYPAQPAPGYAAPAASPAYPPQQPAPAPGMPAGWAIDPITGQPVSSGMPVMGM